MSAAQADSDHHVKDTYNYVTVQTDIMMPKRQLAVLEDTVRQRAFQQAIQTAVQQIEAEDKDCRVLDLGAGAGKAQLHEDCQVPEIHYTAEQPQIAVCELARLHCRVYGSKTAEFLIWVQARKLASAVA